MRATQDGRDDPIVGLAGSNEAIDGQPMGNATVSGYLQCPFASDLVAYQFTQAFPSGFTAWNTGGGNSLSVSVANGTCPNYCGVTVADGFVPFAQVEVEYTAGYEVILADGDAQTGATGGPLTVPLTVQLTTPDPQPKFADKTVVFTLKSAAGHAWSGIRGCSSS